MTNFNEAIENKKYSISRINTDIHFYYINNRRFELIRDLTIQKQLNTKNSLKRREEVG